MGSGKTSTAQYIADFLKGQNRPADLYLEGNLDHPADYDRVAWVDPVAYEALLAHYPDEAALLTAAAVREADGWIIPYGKLGEQLSQPLRQHLQAQDIYDGIPLAKHRELLAANWSRFATQQAARDTTAIFDCAFLQNPMCSFLAKHNAGQQAAVEHVLQLAEFIRPLHPLLIHFHTRDVRATVQRVWEERPVAWRDGVVWYHTELAYGQAHGLQGFDGLVEFLEMRQALELEIAKQLPFETLFIDNTDHNWSDSLALIEQRLTASIR